MKRFNYLFKRVFPLMFAMVFLLGISNVKAQAYGLYFDGNNDYIPLPQSFATIGVFPELTACAWIKIEPGEGGWSMIDFDRSEYFNLEVGWYDMNNNFVGFNTSTSGGTHDLQGTTNVRDGEWHFIAGVYDGTNKYIYVDGVLDATASNPHAGAALGTGATRYGIIGDGSEADSFNGSRNDFFLMGNLKNVSMWTKALTSTKLISIMNNGILGTETDLHSYYKFDEGSGQTVADSGPNGFDTFLGSTSGVDSNDPTWQTYTAEVNNCLSFNGIDESFSIPDNDDFNLLAHSARTIQLFFYADDVSLTGKQMIYDEGGYGNGFNIYLESGTLWVGGWSEGYGWAGNYHSSTAINSNQWHQVTAVFNGVSNTFTAYLDGISIGSASGTSSVISENHEYVNFGAVTATGGTQYHDGDIYQPTVPQDFFAGYIDEFRAYNRALPLSEIRNNMHRELSLSIYGSNMICYMPMNDVVASVPDVSGSGNNGTFTNMTSTNYLASTAPVPYYSIADGDWDNDASWANGQKAPVNSWARVDIYDFITITQAEDCKEIHVFDGASLLGNDDLIATEAIVDIDYSGNQWHLVSSPVSGAVSGMFLGLYLSYHDEPSNAYTYISPINVGLNSMQGYALFNPYGDATASFDGNMNAGSFSMGLSRTNSGGNSGWNLVGNPYPSSIDWNAGSGWTKDNVGATIYFYDGAGGNWATWNGTTGVNGGSRYIAPGQGFFVSVNDGFSSGTLAMDDDVRLHNASSFFKNDAEDIVRLKVSGNGYHDETVIYFSENATEAFDNDLDARKLFSFEEDAPNIYSVDNDGMAINVLPEISTINLNVSVSNEAGSFVIEAIENGNYEDLFLEDKLTGINTNLNEQSYNFDYIKDVESRFVLHFSPLGLQESKQHTTHIYAHGQQLYVQLESYKDATIVVYDMMGQEVSRSEATSGLNTITMNHAGNYLVSVQSDDFVKTEKVFIQ